RPVGGAAPLVQASIECSQREMRQNTKPEGPCRIAKLRSFEPTRGALKEVAVKAGLGGDTRMPLEVARADPHPLAHAAIAQPQCGPAEARCLRGDAPAEQQNDAQECRDQSHAKPRPFSSALPARGRAGQTRGSVAV